MRKEQSSLEADPSSDVIFRGQDVFAWLRWLREGQGLSQRALEDLTGVSQSEIHKIETSQQECRLSSFAVICSELGVPPGWVLDLMISSNVGLFRQRLLSEATFRVILADMAVTNEEQAKTLAIPVSCACVLASILLRTSAPIRRAAVAAYPNPDWQERFRLFAHRLQSQMTPQERLTASQELRQRPCVALHKLGLLSRRSIELHRSALELPPVERRKQQFAWAPWVLTFEDAKSMWSWPASIEPERKLLTETESSGKLPPVKSQLDNLLAALNHLTEETGKKTELADFLGAPLASVSRWLSGDREPGGETTLRMLEWVQAEEAKPRGPRGAETPREPKTQARKHGYEKQTQVRKKQ